VGVFLPLTLILTDPRCLIVSVDNRRTLRGCAHEALGNTADDLWLIRGEVSMRQRRQHLDLESLAPRIQPLGRKEHHDGLAT